MTTTIRSQEQTSREMTAQPKHTVSNIESTRPGPVFVPPLDIFETDQAITLVADMPGVRADGLTIDLRENVLSIEGHTTRVERDGETMLLQEYATGIFRREFKLTNLVDQQRIEASLRDGVLRLTLPKAEAARPRKIAVRAD